MQLATSLVRRDGLDLPDLAERFVREFRHEPRRGYGGGVVDVFKKLDGRLLKHGSLDPQGALKPAKEQFDGMPLKIMLDKKNQFVF